MRRCPECEFFYDDDENVCAMDGTELVNYRGPLPAEETPSRRSAPRRNLYGRSLTLITGGIIVAIALILLVQSVGKRKVQQSNSQAPSTPSTASKGPAPTAVPEAISTLSPSGASSNSIARSKTKATTKVETDRQSDRDPFRAGVPVSSSTPVPKPSPILGQVHTPTTAATINSVSPVAKQREPALQSQPVVSSPREIKPTATNQKSESKISSFLKKTGRALKKPFKN